MSDSPDSFNIFLHSCCILKCNQNWTSNTSKSIQQKSFLTSMVDGYLRQASKLYLMRMDSRWLIWRPRRIREGHQVFPRELSLLTFGRSFLGRCCPWGFWRYLGLWSWLWFCTCLNPWPLVRSYQEWLPCWQSKRFVPFVPRNLRYSPRWWSLLFLRWPILGLPSVWQHAWRRWKCPRRWSSRPWAFSRKKLQLPLMRRSFLQKWYRHCWWQRWFFRISWQ